MAELEFGGPDDELGAEEMDDGGKDFIFGHLTLAAAAVKKSGVRTRKGRGFAERRAEDVGQYESVPSEGSGPGPARCKKVVFCVIFDDGS